MRIGPFGTQITRVVLVTLTLVATSARAAPADLAPDLDSDQQEESPLSPTPEVQAFDISQPPYRPKEKAFAQETFFPYQSSVSPRAGVGLKNQGLKNYYIIGMNYMTDSSSSKHFEFGVDLTAEAYGLLHIARKWIYNHTSAFRPFLKVGPSINKNRF